MKTFVPTVLLMAAFGLAPTWSQDSREKPVDSGIVEQANRRLMQIDVTVRGPATVLSTLTAGDFKLTVGREDIPEFVLDRVCIDDSAVFTDPLAPDVERIAPQLRTLLYFDQIHLTSEGRRRAIELARTLIPDLLAAGRSEAMIVSANRQLDIAAEWSSDPAALLAALDRLAQDPGQVSTWATQENQRVERMMDAIDRATEFVGEVMRAAAGLVPDETTVPIRTRGEAARRQQRIEELKDEMALARTYSHALARDLSREEASRTAAGLDLFSIALQFLEDYAAPKAVVYFADTMRARPGDFYIQLAQAADRVGRLDDARMRGPLVLSTGNMIEEFQAVIDSSIERGIRLYTVQGRGFVEQFSARARGAARVATADPAASKARFKDAEGALVGLARETGGHAFLGADASRMAERILDDLSCLFVLSFHAIQLQQDRATAVWIGVDRPGVELQYRPRLVALSDEARADARLAGAFSRPDRGQTKARVVATPTGFRKGKYTLFVQFAIPGSENSGSDWDMGVTAVVGQSKTISTAGRVAVNQPGLPLVFEAEMRVGPGDYAITAVAKNRDHGEMISTRIDGTLPDPDSTEPFVASVVMLQRVPGAFVRDEATKTSGSLAHGAEHWLRPDRAVGILALVCGNKRADPLTAARSIEGASEVSFDPVELDFAEERCGLLIDSIDAHVLTSGRFSYTVELSRGIEKVLETTRDFIVVSEAEISFAGKPGD